MNAYLCFCVNDCRMHTTSQQLFYVFLNNLAATHRTFMKWKHLKFSFFSNQSIYLDPDDRP